MSFGFSVGDFFAAGKLAWNVYKSCKGAGGAFEEVSHEVIALHTAIKELEDEIENPDSILNRTGAGKKKELGTLVQNCMGVLQQLNKLLIKYKSLGTGSKKAWDRLRWGAENLSEIREKLIAHTSSLTLFLTTLGTGSLGRIEKKLDELIADVRTGRREQTVLTMVDDDEGEAEDQWQSWKSELVDDGFTKAEIEVHKHWIKARLLEFIEGGGLQEEPVLEKSGQSTPKPQAAPKTSRSESAGIPQATVSALKASTSGSQAKNRPRLQPTVEDVDEDEEGAIEPPSITLEAAKVKPTNHLPKRDGGPKDDDAWSEEFDSSDGSEDTFLPTDSISNMGLNTTNANNRGTSIPLHIGNQPSRTSQEKRGSEQGTVERRGTDEERDEEGSGYACVEDDSEEPYFRARPRLADQTARRQRMEEGIKLREEDEIRLLAEEARAARERAYAEAVRPKEIPMHPKRNELKDTAPQYMQSARNQMDQSPVEEARYEQNSPDPRSKRSVPNESREAPTRYGEVKYCQGFENVQYNLNRGLHDGGDFVDYGNVPIAPPEQERTYQPVDQRRLRASPHGTNPDQRRYPDIVRQSPVPRLVPQGPYQSDPNVGWEAAQGTGTYQPRDPGYRFSASSEPYWPHDRGRGSSQPSGSNGTSFSFNPPPPAFQPSSGSGEGFHFPYPDSIFAEFLRGQAGMEGGDGFEDIYQQPRGRERETRRLRASTPDPTTVETPLPLTLEELFKGTDKKIKIKRKSFDEVTGKRIAEEKILEIYIKPGLKKGSKIKFKGVGDQEEGGRQNVHFRVEDVSRNQSMRPPSLVFCTDVSAKNPPAVLAGGR